MNDAPSCRFFVDGHFALEEVTGCILSCDRPLGTSPVWTMQVTGRAGDGAIEAKRVTDESHGLGLMLKALVMIDITFPDEVSAEGVEHVHTASGWHGRGFDLLDDGTVVATFAGPTPPLVERVLIVRPCRVPHPATAAAA